jgi:hypothetical protein
MVSPLARLSARARMVLSRFAPEWHLESNTMYKRKATPNVTPSNRRFPYSKWGPATFHHHQLAGRRAGLLGDVVQVDRLVCSWTKMVMLPLNGRACLPRH